jgi:cytochrome c-type biogenesis protein CcmH
LAKGPTNEQIARMVAMVEQNLAKEPRKIEGWRILTTAYLRLGRKSDAEAALSRALDLAGDDKSRAASITINYAEALVATAGGQVGPRAKAEFARVLGLIPGHPAALYYLGLARLQAGDRDGVLTLWRRIVAAAPANAPWLPGLKKRIERIASGRGMETGGQPSLPKR